MTPFTTLLTRLPGVLLLVTLGVVPALLPVPTSAAPGEPDPVGVWPLVPRPEVVMSFDPPDDPWGAGHRGVDLLGSPLQRVRAALPGRVSFAGRLAGRGVVVVDHGETRTTYEPVAATVSVGDTVAAADGLGALELVGSHCFPRACLHWGWLRGETYLDPLLLVGAGPVRLLPLWREAPVPSARSARSSPVAVLPWARWRPWADVLGWPATVRPAGEPAGRPVGGGPW